MEPAVVTQLALKNGANLSQIDKSLTPSPYWLRPSGFHLIEQIEVLVRAAGSWDHEPLGGEFPAIIEGTGVTGMDVSTGCVALRSMLPPEQMIRTLRSVVAGIDPRLALDHVRPMADAISAAEAPRRNTGIFRVARYVSSWPFVACTSP